jgi:hypothetical protein
VAKRPGGKLREENCSAQSIIPMKLNSIRPKHWKSLRRKGKVDLPRKGSVTPPQRVRAEIIGGVKVVGVSGAGRLIDGPLRTALMLEESSAVVRVPIVAMEHGKAVSVKGGREVKA